ncbi:hypothetical protein QAD02_003731 [Eretmocerus hayati]|uniref:Uncharacterized protein n=1 Tax=Eretmocerus hayati TaxID=131215 RepID=A0ACC2NN11_9HYME|nr:hypothetical protein QAD02_003731 [Eretmocerus hayati]
MVKCLKCPSKGNLTGTIVYCFNYDGIKCLGAYHPSCSRRAGPRSDGSFRTCCPEVVLAQVENQSDNSPLDLSNSSDTDKFSDCEEFFGANSSVSEPVEGLIDNMGSTNMTIGELWVEMKKLVSDESEKINRNVDTKTSEISGKIDDALTRINNLEEKVEDAMDRITVLENIQQSDRSEEQEQMYHEVQDRIQREKNVIVFGVPESDEENFLDKFIEDLFAGKGAPFDMNCCRYHRFGKNAEDKTRPVKIVFNLPEYAKWTLLNQSKFSEHNVKLVNDKTPDQLKYLKDLGKQLDDLKKSGVKNYTIKYIRNIPRIVDIRNSKKKQMGAGDRTIKAPKISGVQDMSNMDGTQQRAVSTVKPSTNSRSRSNSGSSTNSQYSTRKQDHTKKLTI